MKITKYAHACLYLEKSSTKLIIDPGAFTTLPEEIPYVDFIIITEEHFDHFDVENIKKLLSVNQNAQIYSTEAVATKLADADIECESIVSTTEKNLGDMTVTLTPTDHAVVYGSSPCTSLTLKVNNHLYYPSDTYALIPDEVEVLALPTSGPWFKVSESIDFMKGIKSEVVMPTHNALNSEQGNKVTHNFITNNITDTREFTHLGEGESMETEG